MGLSLSLNPAASIQRWRAIDQLNKALQEESPTENGRYFGLQNSGNICYCNAVLQALYACSPFRENLLEYYSQMKPHKHPHEKNGKKTELMQKSLVDTLAELFHTIASQKRRVGYLPPPRVFMFKLKQLSHNFRGSRHQDAHEFLNFTLNRIAEELAAVSQKSKSVEVAKLSVSESQRLDGTKVSWIQELFEGVLTNETRCLCCEQRTYRDETFLDLSLDIEQNTSVSACLRHFSAYETLCDADKFYCESCHNFQEARKCLKLKRLPRVLALHLKRFKCEDPELGYEKLSYRVLFSTKLRLGSSVCATECLEKTYSLFAIVVHAGQNMSFGHYFTLVRGGKTSGCGTQSRWFLCDDDVVEVVSEAYISQFFGGETLTERARRKNAATSQQQQGTRDEAHPPPPSHHRKQRNNSEVSPSHLKEKFKKFVDRRKVEEASETGYLLFYQADDEEDAVDCNEDETGAAAGGERMENEIEVDEEEEEEEERDTRQKEGQDREHEARVISPGHNNIHDREDDGSHPAEERKRASSLISAISDKANHIRGKKRWRRRGRKESKNNNNSTYADKNEGGERSHQYVYDDQPPGDGKEWPDSEEGGGQHCCPYSYSDSQEKEEEEQEEGNPP